jgi:hypothetical protein
MSDTLHTYTIHCLSEAMSPLTHMSGTAGNVAMIAREPVATETGIRWLPFLSGNAIRHRAVREPGMLWLIQQYGLVGKLSLPQLNFLLHGGNLTQSSAQENTKRIAEMHRTWPLLRLLGASLPDQILAGSLDVWRGTLVCEENRRCLASLTDLPAARLLSAERWIGGYQYTRSDAAKRGLASVGACEAPATNLMIFSGQCVERGANFYHGFVLKHVSDIELGALLWSLRLWQQAGGTIGGQAARGHGRLACTLLTEEIDQEALCQRYVDYARIAKDDAVAWLEDAWG